MALGIAAWMRYVTGIDEQGNAIGVHDPLARDLRAIADAADGDPKRYAPAIFDCRPIFGPDLPSERRFTDTVANALQDVFTRGALKALETV